MQLQDHVKRIHQCVFGPAHLHSTPSIEQIQQYITQELLEVEINDDPNIIDIGFGYVRIDIKVIKSSLITIDELSKSFHRSMLLEQKEVSSKHALMKHELTVLMNLIGIGLLPYDTQASQLWIEHYTALGYPALHHSDAYKSHYQPHYRVIHHQYLPDKLKK
jgi:hypothetical protein